MKPTRELIDAMRVTANRIESGEYEFNWTEPNNCYCGCLARTVLKLDNWNAYDKLVENYIEVGAMWSERARKQYCSTTGIKLDDVFKALYDIGLTSPQDFMELEFTGNTTLEEFRNSYTSISSYEFVNKEYAINYFRTKADQLEIQLLNQQTLVTTNQQAEVQPVTVK